PRTRAPCRRRAAWPAPGGRRDRTRAARFRWQSCEELRLEQRQHEVDQQPQRDETADDVEQWHASLLHAITELDERPGEAEEEDAQSDVERVHPVHVRLQPRTIEPFRLKTPSRSGGVT